MLLLDYRRPVYRRASLAVAILFFNATFFLSARPGGFGVSTASAMAPPGDDRPSVYVVEFQRGGDYVSEMALKKIESYYRTLLSMNSGVTIVQSAVKAPVEAEAAPKPRPMVQDKDLEKADKLLWKGKDQLREKKWRKAVKSFGGAIKRYKKKVALLEDLDKMVEAMLLLSIARFAQGYEENGEEDLAKVLVLRPDLVVDRRWKSPAFTASIKRLKDGLFRVPTGTLTVKCPNTQCKVYIDGIVRGSDGASVTGLARGHHFVRVVTPGFQPWAKSVFTPAKGKSKTVVAKAKPLKNKRATTKKAKRKEKAAQVSPALLASFVREGNYRADFLVKAGEFARQSGADNIVMGFVNRVGKQYVVAAYVYSATQQQVAEVTKSVVQVDISDLQVKLLDWEQKVSESFAKFPTRRVVTESPPRVYAAYVPPATAPAPKPAVVAPVPVVAKAPTPAVKPVLRSPGK